MDTIVLNVIAFVIILPLSLLFHEIGHGIGTVVTTETRHVHIYLGEIGENNKENFNLGRLHLHLQWALNGRCVWGDGLTRRQVFVSLLGGPLMTGLIMIVCISILRLNLGEWTRLIFIAFGEINLFILLFTLIPNQLPQSFGPRFSFPSDGLQMVRMLRSK